jgi:hypothetical protein
MGGTGDRVVARSRRLHWKAAIGDLHTALRAERLARGGMMRPARPFVNVLRPKRQRSVSRRRRLALSRR